MITKKLTFNTPNASNSYLILQVSGLPIPELMWLVNGRPIYPDLHHKMLVRENGIHSLVIDPLTQNDNGTYTCIASNKAGQSSFSLELKVVGKTVTLLWFDEKFLLGPKLYDC